PGKGRAGPSGGRPAPGTRRSARPRTGASSASRPGRLRGRRACVRSPGVPGRRPPRTRSPARPWGRGGRGRRPAGRSPTPVGPGVIDRTRPRTRTGERRRTGRCTDGPATPPRSGSGVVGPYRGMPLLLRGGRGRGWAGSAGPLPGRERAARSPDRVTACIPGSRSGGQGAARGVGLRQAAAGVGRSGQGGHVVVAVDRHRAPHVPEERRVGERV